MSQTASSIWKQAALALVFVIIGAGPAVSADNFGAIAFSKATGAYGYSFDHQSRRNAEASAMNACRSRSRGCTVTIWFKNACGSVATGPNGWGSAWAGSRANAERAALANCSKHTRNCKVLAWSCTTL